MDLSPWAPHFLTVHGPHMGPRVDDYCKPLSTDPHTPTRTSCMWLMSTHVSFTHSSLSSLLSPHYTRKAFPPTLPFHSNLPPKPFSVSASFFRPTQFNFLLRRNEISSMGIERGSLKGFRTGGWSVPPKPCDSCKSAAAAVFCRADSAFLCMLCDNNIHSANKLASRHERVWMCEVCEQAPASVTCRADAAVLCVACDSDIHSANPLARRHERVPVEPFFDSADSVAKSSAAAFNLLVPTDNGIGSDGLPKEESESASWLISNPTFTPKIMDVPDIKSGEMFFPEMEHPFLDFDYSNPFDQNNNNRQGNNDSLVPVQASAPVMNQTESCFDMDFCRSKLSAISYPTQSFSRQSISSSSADFGVVPDGGNTASEISLPFGGNISNSSESSGIISAGNSTSQLGSSSLNGGMNREARVLRYREKRKNRKFEKTVRYASRKAYAETRPRIKGRFAKRTTEMESDFDRLFSSVDPTTDLLLDTQYGVVPSF